jgi:hypothetical protein
MRGSGTRQRAERLFLLAGLLAAPAASVAAQQGGVTGVVRDAATQRPIGGVAVSVSGAGRGTLSGENGLFTISGLSAGTYQVGARKLGYASTSRSITVTGGLATRSSSPAPPRAHSAGPSATR